MVLDDLLYIQFFFFIAIIIIERFYHIFWMISLILALYLENNHWIYFSQVKFRWCNLKWYNLHTFPFAHFPTACGLLFVCLNYVHVITGLLDYTEPYQDTSLYQYYIMSWTLLVFLISTFLTTTVGIHHFVIFFN